MGAGAGAAAGIGTGLGVESVAFVERTDTLVVPGAPPWLPQPMISGVIWLAGTGFCIHASSCRTVTK
jgi:hypothetical protein